MLAQKEREHLNAVIRIISDKAERIDHLNRVRLEGPVAFDAALQLRVIEEALALTRELKDLTDEALGMLETDHSEHLEVYQK